MSPVPEPDTSVAQSARIWNYWLGGTDNFPVDRAAGDAVLAVYPGMNDIARDARRYLTRAVTFLAGEAGVRQFLDAGAGLPTVDNTHQIAGRAAPGARVVYVDKDPYAVAHGRALLGDDPDAPAVYYEGNLQEPEGILAIAAKELDLTRPVGLILNGCLGHMPSTEEARRVVSTLLAGLPPGSYLSVSDGVRLAESVALNASQDAYNESGAVPYFLRTPEEILSLFDGLEIVPPGVVPLPLWRPAPGDEPTNRDQYAGVGRTR